MDRVLFTQYVGMAVRYVLVTYGADTLIHHGIWTAENAEANALKVAAGTAALFWAVYMHWNNRQKLVEARIAPSMPMSEATKK